MVARALTFKTIDMKQTDGIDYKRIVLEMIEIQGVILNEVTNPKSGTGKLVVMEKNGEALFVVTWNENHTVDVYAQLLRSMVGLGVDFAKESNKTKKEGTKKWIEGPAL